MGLFDALPVVSQLKSAVQAAAGDFEGARQTQEQFSKRCPVISQARSAVEATYDTEAARRTQLEFVDTLESTADGTPIVGHVKGSVHYALGDREKGDGCMKSATRTGAVMAAGAATGGSGLLVAAGAAAATGALTDIVTTGVDSAIHGEFRPSGIIEAVETAADSRKPGDIFDAAFLPCSDAMAGADAAKAASKAGKAATVAKEIEAAKRAVAPLPDGTVLTRMHGTDGHVVTGVNSQTRQVSTRKQFGLSKRQALRHSKDMPITLRDAHPNPPTPRIGGACAEHHAANKLTRVNDTPARTITAAKRNGKIEIMKRCDNCRRYGNVMGEVVTDSEYPRVGAWAPPSNSAITAVVAASKATSNDSAEA